MKYKTVAGNHLFCGDSFNIIDNMIQNNLKVDAIITDPPYEHVKGGMKSKKFNVGIMKEHSFLNTELNNFNRSKVLSFLEKTKHIFKTTYNGYYFCSKLQVPYYLEFATKNKLNFDILIWDRDKNNMTSTKFYASNIDYIIRIYGKKQGLRNLGDIDNKAEYYQKIQKFKKPKDYGHPTEKPLELIEGYILLSTDEEDVVLDPFMGTGTTGVACKKHKRNFIGIEIDNEIYGTALKRIEKLYEG